MLQEFKRRGLKFVGFSFDGNTRLRQVLFALMRDATLAAPTGSTFTLAHDLIELHGVYLYPDCAMPLMAFSDWLHIVFRLRRQLLEPARRLEIGGL